MGRHVEDARERVEHYAGRGTLTDGARVLSAVPYDITRFQGLAASGLPVPGVHRIEGKVDLSEHREAAAALVGNDLTLELEDGRRVRVTLADGGGRVFAVGHGPSRCGCC